MDYIDAYWEAEQAAWEAEQAAWEAREAAAQAFYDSLSDEEFEELANYAKYIVSKRK